MRARRHFFCDWFSAFSSQTRQLESSTKHHFACYFFLSAACAYGTTLFGLRRSVRGRRPVCIYLPARLIERVYARHRTVAVPLAAGCTAAGGGIHSHPPPLRRRRRILATENNLQPGLPWLKLRLVEILGGFHAVLQHFLSSVGLIPMYFATVWRQDTRTNGLFFPQ